MQSLLSDDDYLKGLGLSTQQVPREVSVSKSVSTTGMRAWHVGLDFLGCGAGEGPKRGGIRWEGVRSFYPFLLGN